MDPAEAIDQGRKAFDRYAWGDAYTRLSAADQQTSLEAADLERLAVASYLTGRESQAVEGWERAHTALLGQGQIPRAVRCAFWLGIVLMLRGEHAQGGGWLARAQRLLDDAAIDCVEQGYLLIPAALQALEGGDGQIAYATFDRVAEMPNASMIQTWWPWAGWAAGRR